MNTGLGVTLFWYKPLFFLWNYAGTILVGITRIMIYIRKQEGLYQNKVTSSLQPTTVNWAIPSPNMNFSLLNSIIYSFHSCQFHYNVYSENIWKESCLWSCSIHMHMINPHNYIVFSRQSWYCSYARFAHHAACKLQVNNVWFQKTFIPTQWGHWKILVEKRGLRRQKY